MKIIFIFQKKFYIFFALFWFVNFFWPKFVIACEKMNISCNEIESIFLKKKKKILCMCGKLSEKIKWFSFHFFFPFWFCISSHQISSFNQEKKHFFAFQTTMTGYGFLFRLSWFKSWNVCWILRARDFHFFCTYGPI